MHEKAGDVEIPIKNSSVKSEILKQMEKEINVQSKANKKLKSQCKSHYKHILLDFEAHKTIHTNLNTHFEFLIFNSQKERIYSISLVNLSISKIIEKMNKSTLEPIEYLLQLVKTLKKLASQLAELLSAFYGLEFLKPSKAKISLSILEFWLLEYFFAREDVNSKIMQRISIISFTAFKWHQSQSNSLAILFKDSKIGFKEENHQIPQKMICLTELPSKVDTPNSISYKLKANDSSPGTDCIQLTQIGPKKNQKYSFTNLTDFLSNKQDFVKCMKKIQQDLCFSDGKNPFKSFRMMRELEIKLKSFKGKINSGHIEKWLLKNYLEIMTNLIICNAFFNINLICDKLEILQKIYFLGLSISTRIKTKKSMAKRE